MADVDAPKLTPKQQKFVDAYCGKARFNASEAVRLAGYATKNPDDMGYQLRKTPYIRARIDEILNSNTLRAPEILRELTDVAMRDLDEEIEVRKFGKDDNGDPVLSARMDASAKMKALEMLGKAHGIFTENINHTGGIDIQIVGVDTDKL